VTKLHLMLPSGEMGLMPGAWQLWVGGTSPRTPKSLLQGSAGASAGSPQMPLTVDFTVVA
jgi:hypothetical protein